MRTLVTIASVVVLAGASVACEQGSNSARDLTAFPTALSPTMLQAKGGNGNGKGNISPLPPVSMTVAMVNDVGAEGVSRGDTVEFDIAPATSGAFVSLNCYQGSEWVYAMGGYPSDRQFLLLADSWPSGAADCTAALYTTIDGTRPNTLATLSFHVAG
jgi:hypothetical protein